MRSRAAQGEGEHTGPEWLSIPCQQLSLLDRVAPAKVLFLGAGLVQAFSSHELQQEYPYLQDQCALNVENLSTTDCRDPLLSVTWMVFWASI